MEDSQPSVSFKPSAVENEIEINQTTITLPSAPSAQDSNSKSNPLNFDNKAFELEDVDIDNPDSNKNPFNRMERPGSMMSVGSTASKSSRSSVNCTTGQIRCPNLRLKKFFSYRTDTGFQKASEEIKRLILPEKDGSFLGNWLLIEISSWDLHREKIVLLTEKTLMIIAYDFIKNKIYSYNRVSLADLKKVTSGSLKYPKGSMMGEYLYGAIKIAWGEENLSFYQRWSPVADIPFVLFTSHHIIYNEKEKETELYNCDEFIASLEYALSKLPEAKVEFKEEPIEISSYASLISVLYNQNWLGFQLDRNGINY